MPYLDGFETHAANKTDLCRNILEAYDEAMVNKIPNDDNKLSLASAIKELVEEAHHEYSGIVAAERAAHDTDDITDHPGHGYNGSVDK